jgi:hypothetical protein
MPVARGWNPLDLPKNCIIIELGFARQRGSLKAYAGSK